MNQDPSKQAQLDLIQLVNESSTPELSKILNLVMKFPKLPKELESIGLAKMKYSEATGFERPKFPSESIDSAFYWTGSLSLPLSFIRINKKGFRDSFLTINSAKDAVYFMDDDRDSSVIHKDGKSLVITHSDTDYGHEPFLDWLKTQLQIMVYPYGAEYKG